MEGIFKWILSCTKWIEWWGFSSGGNKTVQTCLDAELEATITDHLIVRAALMWGLKTASGLVVLIARLRVFRMWNISGMPSAAPDHFGFSRSVQSTVQEEKEMLVRAVVICLDPSGCIVIWILQVSHFLTRHPQCWYAPVTWMRHAWHECGPVWLFF